MTRHHPTVDVDDLKRAIPEAKVVALDLYGIKFQRGTARCPIASRHKHGDRDPSLRFDRKRNRIFCASQNCFDEKGSDAIDFVRIMDGCDFPSALSRLADHYGITASNAEPRSTSRRTPPCDTSEENSVEEAPVLAGVARRSLEVRGFHCVAEYLYGDHLRNVRFEHISNLQPDKNKPEKTFRWEHRIDDSWYSGAGGLPKPLYTNRVFQSHDQSSLVIGFEGEAKADVAAEMGFAGFSFKHITAEQADALVDLDVVLWPDNDESGANQAASAAKAINQSGNVRSVRMVSAPVDFPPGGDIIDAINTLGWDHDQIQALVRAAVPFESDSSLSCGDAARAKPKQKSPPKNTSSARRLAFVILDTGVFVKTQNAEGKSALTKICDRLDVLAQTRDANGKNWGRLLSWRDNEFREHLWAMPVEILSSDANAVRSRLLGDGLPYITTNAKMRERFAEYIQTWPTDRRILCVSRIGWHGDHFILPDAAFGPGDKELLYQNAQETTHYWNVSGTSDTWRESIGRKCIGNSRLILAVSCAFAGPLLSLAGSESGGIHFHGASSTGKSTALVVGGSVCGGGGEAGFLQTWRVTVNGLEAIAESHNDATLFLDELAQIDPKEAADTAYMLANGQGKSRMTKTMGTRPKLTWNVMFVSAGEVTLAEHAASAGRSTRAGVDVRLLNVKADAGKGTGLFENIHGAASPNLFVHELRDAVRNHYGAPFREFLTKLTLDWIGAKQAIVIAQEALARHVPEGSTGQVMRAAQRFALIAAAGELATEWGITGWDSGDATEASERCLNDWIIERGTIGNADLEAGIRQVASFLSVHGTSRFPLIGSSECDGRPFDEKQMTRDRAGFRRRSKKNGTDETEYLIFPETFRLEVCANRDYMEIARELAKRGFLKREPNNLMIKPRLPELGPSRVYCVLAGVLERD